MKANIRTPWAIGLAAAAAVLALSGCGNSGMSGPATAAAPTATAQPTSGPAVTASPSSEASSSVAVPAEILIKGFKYQGPDTVSPGAVVTVINEDIEAHTITADAGTAFDAIIKVGTGTFTAPTEPGTYPYHCIFHGNMHGTLTVK